MAVVLITSIDRYVGASGDTKPTSGVPAGSEFFESDTGHKYMFDGTNWFLTVTRTDSAV